MYQLTAAAASDTINMTERVGSAATSLMAAEHGTTAPTRASSQQVRFKHGRSVAAGGEHRNGAPHTVVIRSTPEGPSEILGEGFG